MSEQVLEKQVEKYDWLRKLFRHPAPIIIMEGKMDSGKTDFALHMGEKGLGLGFINEIGTNIKVGDARFLRICSIERLRKWFFYGGDTRKLFIFDEASSHIDRRNPLSRINKEFRHIGFKVRKAHGKIIIIGQRTEDVDSTFDDPDIIIGRIRKLWKKEALINSQLFPKVLHITDIPRTKVDFDTYDIAPFTLEEQGDPEEMKGRSLCCHVARLYVKHGNLSTIGKLLPEKGFTQKPLKAMQVKRLLQKHIKHTL